MHREECDALRAELEARRDEIATLRGVVAALRGRRSAAPRPPSARATSRAIAAIALLIGIAAIVAARWGLAALLCR
jgi:anti-sigma factor RsiW